MGIGKAAVFGASGAVGRSVARELVRRGIETRVVSRSRLNLTATYSGMEVDPHVADLTFSLPARIAVESCDTIFHCVGVPLDRFEDHLRITENTLKAVQTTGSRIVLVSSFWSYGPAGTDPIEEDHPREARAGKGLIRKQQEDLFLAEGGAVVILPDFYGPEATSSWLNRVLDNVARNRIANWIGSLERPHEFFYVPDAGFPLVELAMQPDAYGQRWHLGGAGPIQPRWLLGRASEYCRTSLRLRTPGRFLLSLLAPFNPEIRELLEMLPLYSSPPLLNAGKLKRLIGDYPVTPYTTGIAATVDWLRRG